MAIYFDNSATTKVDEEVIEVITDAYRNLYSNPSAMHRFGFMAEEKVKEASRIVAKTLNCDEKEIIWTSGGSESNNMAIMGVVNAYQKKGKHIITTVIEHAAVLKVYDYLESLGFEATYLDVDETGHIDIEELKNAIRKDTILVSIMYVNNIIGSKQDIEKIGNVIKEINSNCFFHVDAVQGYTKYKINVTKYKIDLLSVSTHKFHGPKGVGFLYKNKNVRIKPLIYGGGQQDNLRSGTLNVPGIIGTAKAAEIAYNNFDDNIKKFSELKYYLIDELNKLNTKYNIITINSKKDETFVPHIVSISFKGIGSEIMLHALEEKEIYVSAGSACSSHDKKTSGTLINIGLKKEEAESTIRVSFGKYNNQSEIDIFIKTLDEILPRLLITRKK